MAGPSDLKDVIFRPVDQAKYPEILDLLYANFHTDEPMSRAPAMDDYTLKALKENLSIMAVDSVTNKLLGPKNLIKESSS